MLILRAGLYLAVAIAAYVVWASVGAGYAIEVAMLRGLLAAMAIATIAYAAELVVLTAPVRGRQTPEAPPRTEEAPDDTTDPVNLPAVRAERSAAADRRRAA